MSVQTLKVSGRKFVILPESEYRKLQQKAGGPRRIGTPARKNSRRAARNTEQEAGDLAEATRRLAEPSRPYSELRKKLGLA
jgi:hypothetical protein